MQITNLLNNHKQKQIQSHNPLKQLFSYNLSPRYKQGQNLKQKQTTCRIQICNKYHYSQDQLIGDGFTSKVYKGYDIQKTNKIYAIKVIDKKKLNDDQIKLIKNQIEVHPKLDHQNIVKCYDVFNTQKLIYIVMEYCPNGDLSQFIKENRDKCFSELKAIQFMEQIIQGYKYLIKQGILHRDLKPANILRSGKILKIADFGFAIKGRKTLIDAMSVGTPLYMPPQSLQQCFYSHKSDFFALGCIFYQLLHGKTPWYKNDEKALATLMKNKTLDLSNVKNHNIKEFIFAACQISQSFRISIDQFLEFDLRKPINHDNLNLSHLSNPQSAKNARSFLRQKSDRKNSKKSRQQAAKSQKSKKSQTTMQATFVSSHTYFKNAKCQQTVRITAQLQQKFQFCLLLKYLIQNSQDTLLIQQFQKKNLKIVLFRHFLYALKRLITDCSRIKSFDPKSWQNYKQTDQYKLFFQQCKLMKQKMQKDFNLQLKGMSLRNLSEVNKKFSELNYQYDLTKSFYQKLREFLQDIMRKFHAEIMKKYPKSNQNLLPKGSNDVNARYFQAFRSLNLYIQHIEQKINTQVQNFNKSLDTLNSSNLNRVSTSKNNSNTSNPVNNNSFHSNKINSSFIRKNNSQKTSQKQLIQGVKSQKKKFLNDNQMVKKDEDHFHYYNYFTYTSQQSHKAKQNHMNMTSNPNIHSNSENYKNQYYHQYNYNTKSQNQNINQNNKNHHNKHDSDHNELNQTTNFIKSKNEFQSKSKEKQNNLLNVNRKVKFVQNQKLDQVNSVQDHFRSSLCRNYQESRMTKQEFIALKKKIKWLW